MKYRNGKTIFSAALLAGAGVSVALSAVPRPGGFRGAAAPHPVPHAIPHAEPGFHAGIPHGGPAFHPAEHAEFARHAGPAFHDPALFHAPGAHWNGYHQVVFGGRPMHLGWAGYRPSFYYHPWYHGPWGGHVWGWGWSFAPGVAFSFGGGGVGVGVGWGYGAPYRPYGAYGYWGRPLGWGFGGWGLGTITYSSGYYPYYNPYYAGYSGPAVFNYANPIPVAAQPGPGAVAESDPDGPAPQADNPAFDAAREEFRHRRYSAALSSVDAAIRQVPSDAVLHEFRALVLFALRDYRQAAAVAHSVLAVGPGWDWTTMSGLYADPGQYAQQLAALEDYTQEHPRAADAHFLLGYHYMIAGHSQEAAIELQHAVKLMPTDRLAGELLMMVKGPPQQPEQSDPGAAPEGGAVPEPPPVEKEALVGNWHASRPDGSKFHLTLSEDGRFRWKFSMPDQKGDDFSGTYTVEGPVLALQRKEGGVLAGTATFEGNRHFNFRMVGGPPEDQGLDFIR